MTWQAPEWLWLAAAAIMLLAGVVVATRWRRRQQTRIASAGVWRRWLGGAPATGGLRMSLLTLAAALAAAGAARPHGIPAGPSEKLPASIVVAVDVSTSMLAADVPPTRLSRGLDVVRTALAWTPLGACGVVAGGASAVPVVPLTTDHTAVLAALSREIWPEHLLSGTDLAALLSAAGSAAGGTPGGRIVILISDGEEWHGDSMAVARTLKRAGIRVLAVLTGTTDSAPVPAQGSPGGNGGSTRRYLRLEDGTIAVTRARPEVLERLTGSAELVIDAGHQEAVDRLRNLLEESREAGLGQRGEDLSTWFYLAAALVGSLAFAVWPWRRLGPTAVVAGVVVLGSCAGGGGSAEPDWPAVRDRMARQVQADPHDRGALLSWATAAAVCGDEEGEALLRTFARDVDMKAVALYNLGTARLLRGEALAAVEPLRAAVAADPGAARAWHNLELAETLARAVAAASGSDPRTIDPAGELLRSAARAATGVEAPPLPAGPVSAPGGPPW